MSNARYSILYVGSLQKDGNAFRRFETLGLLGNHVTGVDTDPYIMNTLLRPLYYHISIGPGIYNLNRKVVSAVKKTRPDILWVDNKPYLTASTLRKLRSACPGMKIVNILTDDFGGAFHRSWRLTHQTAALYDVHFVQREINIPELKSIGAIRVELCFRSFDKRFHKPMTLSENEKSKYECEVGFIGTYEKEREEYVAFLIQNGIPVTVTGDGWPHQKHWDIIKDHYKGHSVYGEEYVRKINGMRIALHFLRRANRDQQDSRTFEIPACETFMLAERSNLHQQFFKEGEEAAFFCSKEELLEKTKYYLDHPGETERIARGGYQRSYNSEYYHEHRMEEVLNKIFNPSQNGKKFRRIVTSIYHDPDFYPPTINAIINLSEITDELVVVTRNNTKNDFPYPGNVRMVKVGKYITVRDTETSGFYYKVTSYLKFTLAFRKYARLKDTGLAVMYDSIPLFSFFLVKSSLNKHATFWYHNHDMPNIGLLRKYSIGWYAARFEHKAMQHINLFSLPSNDRLAYYQNWQYPDRYFCIPNYPSLKAAALLTKPFVDNEIRVIFQGSIGELHALEEMILLLKENIGGRPLRLILKGSVRPHYKMQLTELAKSEGVSDKLTWVGLGPYCELRSLTASCHIGIAIHMGSDDVRKTLGTASNKIYEYAASGLPVILYDIEQFRKYLDQYCWAFFCDGTIESLKHNIELILKDYDSLSDNARASFEQSLNFEKCFLPVLKKLEAIE